MSGRIEIDGRSITTSVSIGVVVNPPVGATTETVSGNADVAMYAAKTSGRGRCMVFEKDMRKAAARRIRLLEDIRHAVEHGALQSPRPASRRG